MKVLVLGHTGMLGSTVVKYLKYININVLTIQSRWGSDQFKKDLTNKKYDYVINCIANTKKNCNFLDYKINTCLPIELDNYDNLGTIIHCDTDSTDNSHYSVSKKLAFDYIKNFGKKTKVIKCSLIGQEGKNNFMSWLLSSKGGTVNGYTNHYWNGITTLEWAKICKNIIEDPKKYDLLVPTTDCVSKYDLIKIINEVYNLNLTVIPTINSISIYNCLESNLYYGNVKNLLQFMKCFYTSGTL